jgi:hypothetical protein
MKNEVTTKLMKAFEKDAEEYLQNIESPLSHKLDKDDGERWKQEIKEHFINGMLHVLYNPEGGSLLYINKKSYDLGYNDGYDKGVDDVIHGK